MCDQNFKFLKKKFERIVCHSILYRAEACRSEKSNLCRVTDMAGFFWFRNIFFSWRSWEVQPQHISHTYNKKNEIENREFESTQADMYCGGMESKRTSLRGI